jgi:hypothetical protein
VFGPVWTDALKSLWSDPRLSLRKMARELGVDVNTALIQASRHRLSETARRIPSRIKLRLKSAVQSGPIRSVDDYQSRWLKIVASNPGVTRKALRNMAPKLYSFLRRHVPQWLNTNSPSRTAAVVTSRTNWADRDEKMSSEIPRAARRLLLRVPLIRLTPTAILRESGAVWALTKLRLLPKTESQLKGLAESRINFAVRKIKTVAKQFGPLKRWKLIRLANLRPDLASDPVVSETLQDVLQHLDSDLSS